VFDLDTKCDKHLIHLDLTRNLIGIRIFLSIFPIIFLYLTRARRGCRILDPARIPSCHLSLPHTPRFASSPSHQALASRRV